MASIPKVDPFVVPDGLFERFPHQVQARVTTHVPGLRWSPWVKRLALALPVVAVLAGAWWMLRSTDAPVEQVAVVIPETTVDELESSTTPSARFTLRKRRCRRGERERGPDRDELAAWLETEQTDLSQRDHRAMNTLMTRLLSSATLVLASTLTFAQADDMPPIPDDKLEEIKAQKVAYITQKMG